MVFVAAAFALLRRNGALAVLAYNVSIEYAFTFRKAVGIYVFTDARLCDLECFSQFGLPKKWQAWKNSTLLFMMVDRISVKRDVTG